MKNLKQFLEAFEPDHEKDPEKQLEKHNEHFQDVVHDNNSIPENDDLYQYSLRSEHINKYLHRTHTDKNYKPKPSEPDKLEDIKNRIKSIDRSLDKAHFKKRDTHVFTGLHPETINHIQDHVEKHPDKILKYHHPAYISTSTDYSTAKMFSQSVSPNQKTIENRRNDLEYEPKINGRHILKIHLKKGDKAASIRDQAKWDDEHEILIHRGHNVEVHPKPTVMQDGTHIWHGRLAEHNPHKIED